MRIDKLFSLILAFTCSVSFATDPKKEQIAEALMWEIPVEQLVKACNTEQVKDGHFCYFAGAKTKNMPERLNFFKKACFMGYGKGCSAAWAELVYVKAGNDNKKIPSVSQEALPLVQHGCSIKDGRSCYYLASMYLLDQFGIFNVIQMKEYLELSKEYLRKGCLYHDQLSCELFAEIS